MKAIVSKAVIRSWLVGLILLVPGVSQAAIISVDSVSGGAIDTSVGVNIGDSFAVDVVIEDLADLAGFQFLLGFDSAILNATGVTSGNIFGIDTFLIDNTVGASSVSFAETTFAINGIDIVGTSLLATINFNAIASGVSALSLSNVLLSDSLAGPIQSVTINGAAATVNGPVNVPAPASLLLLLSGLSLFAAKRK